MNKKTLLFSLIFILTFCFSVFSQDNIKVSGTASKGGKIIRVSANIEYKLMETYPVCTVTVYNAGTLTLSSIFSDEIGTPKANPFTSGTDASYWFYVAPGRYDIKFSGTGITVPFTISDVFVATGGGGAGSVTSFNGRTGVVIPLAGDYTFSGLDFTGSNFNSIATRSASDLNAGTLPNAVFPATLPAISGINLTDLNASNITSGTLADARLSGNVPLKNGTNLFTGVNTFSNNAYFTGTSVGIGTSLPDRKLDVLDPSSAQLRLSSVDNIAYADFYVDSGGTLNLSTTGDITFDAAGNRINPLNNYDQNLGQVNKKYLSLWAAELNVETLVAQNTIATIGGRILVAPTNQLISDLSPAATTIEVKYNNFASGDRVYMEGNGGVEFFGITSAATPIVGGFSYTVTRNLDGTGPNQWYAGDAMVNTGVSGDGFIDLYSINGVNTPTHLGPTIVGNVRNSQTYNDWTERWAIGNLNGLFGYGTDTYGFAAGVPTGAWIKVDPTNGVRIGYNSTTKTQIDNAGNATFTGSITAATGNIAGWTINAASIQSGTTYLASNFAVPVGQVAWFGKSTTGQQGVVLSDASSRYLSMLVNDGTIYPYIYMSDGTRARVVIGGLNNNWGSEGSVNSMGMKVWDSAGLKLVEFSDVTNTIAGVTIANNKMYIGTGTFNNTNTAFYVDNSGQFSLKDKLSWNGTTLTIAGNIALTSLTSTLSLSGASSAIAIGTTPPTSATNGTGIWIDRTGLYALNANLQRTIVNSNGILQLKGYGAEFDTGTSIYFKDLTGGVNRIAQFTGAFSNGPGGENLFSLFGYSDGASASAAIVRIRAEDLTGTRRPIFELFAGASESSFRIYDPTGANFTGVRIGSNTAPTVTLDVTGDIKTNSVQWNTGTKPTCNSSNRGKVWYVAGGAGVVDTFEVCKKDAGDAYAWTSLY